MKNVGIYIMLWCIATAYGLLLYSGSGGDYMGIAEWVAIGVALLGVAGGIWMQVVQFKKDAQRIDGVNKTAGDVKNDTAEMKPKIENIDKNCFIIKEDIVRNVMPGVNGISWIQGAVTELLEEKHINDTMRNKVSSSVNDPLYIQNALKLVYEKNAQLERENSELYNDKLQLEAKLTMLQNEKNALQTANEILQKENRTLQNELQKLKERDNPGRGR